MLLVPYNHHLFLLVVDRNKVSTTTQLMFDGLQMVNEVEGALRPQALPTEKIPPLSCAGRDTPDE